MKYSKLFFATLALAASGLVACGDDEATGASGTGGGGASSSVPSCMADPYACPADQTCSYVDASGNVGCVKAGNLGLGDPCLASVNPSAPESPCGPGLYCIQTTNAESGKCVPFCDDAHPCPHDAACLTIFSADGTTQLPSACDPAAIPSGTGGSGGSGGAGTGGSGTGGTGGAGTGGTGTGGSGGAGTGGSGGAGTGGAGGSGG